MDEKIDDDSYNAGRALFASGASIRSIIEAHPAAASAEDDPAAVADDKTFSTVLGFVDAMFDVLRGAILK